MSGQPCKHAKAAGRPGLPCTSASPPKSHVLVLLPRAPDTMLIMRRRYLPPSSTAVCSSAPDGVNILHSFVHAFTLMHSHMPQ